MAKPISSTPPLSEEKFYKLLLKEDKRLTNLKPLSAEEKRSLLEREKKLAKAFEIK